MDGSILRKNEYRSLLKICFKNPIFSLVPYEIWRDLIVSTANLEAIVLISQSCYAFKNLVDDIGEKNFNLALSLRREGQIRLAKKYLFACADSNNSLAMFHIGYGYFFNGWGLRHSFSKAANWFEKSAECGNATAMAFYAYCSKNFLSKEFETHEDKWGSKAFASKNSSAIGFCYYWGLGTRCEISKAIEHFQIAALDGDEFAQFFCAYCSSFGRGLVISDAFYWYSKSSEQGLADSQYELGCLYRDGIGCEKDVKQATIWLNRAANQGLEKATTDLKQLEKQFTKKHGRSRN